MLQYMFLSFSLDDCFRVQRGSSLGRCAYMIAVSTPGLFMRLPATNWVEDGRGCCMQISVLLPCVASILGSLFCMQIVNIIMVIILSHIRPHPASPFTFLERVAGLGLLGINTIPLYGFLSRLDALKPGWSPFGAPGWKPGAGACFF